MARRTAHQRIPNLRKTVSAVLLAVLASTTGCGDGSDQPELGLVSGTVTLDGSPLFAAVVTFRPSDGRPAMGTTDFDGRYQLTYIRDEPGCKVGLNRVEITNSEDLVEGDELEGDDLIQEPTKEEAPAAAAEIPARYNVQTELEANVQPGENTFNFDLTSQDPS